MTVNTITLDHGSGGRASHELISTLFRRCFNNDILDPLEDSAVLDMPGGRLAFSTDSFVVDPIFFPGGNIGDLAINGTVNDLAMRGALPLFLSVGMILEEGLPLADLEIIVRSMQEAADRAGVKIVTGDTKVVPAGRADKIYINTSGVGVVDAAVNISGANAKPGDHVILSGTMADHGVTILCRQEGLKIEGDFQSDSAPLSRPVNTLLGAFGSDLHVLRDPTRGGVATTLNEIARSSGLGIVLHEENLPVRKEVLGACELLGLDPLYLANEGKFLAFVPAAISADVLRLLQQDEYGRDARLIGETVTDERCRVVLHTAFGSSRLLDMLHGNPLPRIC